MTKKHFNQFAKIIKTQLKSDKLCAFPRGEVMANMISDVALKDNPKFNEVRFRRACGLDDKRY